MSADYERQLLHRAAELADTSDLARAVVVVLAGARRARLDPRPSAAWSPPRSSSAQTSPPAPGGRRLPPR